MKKNMVTVLVGVGLAALLVGGCANKENVKKEGLVPPAIATEKSEQQSKPAEQVKPSERNHDIQSSQAGTAQTNAGGTAVSAGTLETAYFDYDKSDLRQDTRDVLSRNAETILKSLVGKKIQIEGHCDERGSAEYNLALGERRAKSAQQYLTTLGVKAEALSVISYGKEKPAVNGSDESAWAKNRRAEFTVFR